MIAAVIVTYNRLELLKECLCAVLQQTNQDYDVLVIDNASTDGTKEYILSLCDKFRIKYFQLDENIGGAGGFCFGIKEAIRMGYDYVWLMDDDTIPDCNCLQEMIDADRLIGKGAYGYLSSAVFWIDGTECKMNRQKVQKNYYKGLQYLQNGIILIEQATFVSLFIPRETIVSVGLPIKEYFIWGDDIEYTRRIAVRHNLPSYLIGKSKVVHKMSNNEGSSIAKDDVHRIGRYNFAYRNDNSTYRREGFEGFCYYTGKCAINILRVILYAKDYKIKRLGIIVKNYFKGLFFNPSIEMVDQGD